MKNLFTLIVCLYMTTTSWSQVLHDYYWVGTSSNTVQGSGEWTDLNAWRLDSLTGAIPLQVPISNNNVYFMAGAFPTVLPGADSGAITVSTNASCDTFHWDSAIPTLSKKIVFQSNTLGTTGPSNINLDIYGILRLREEDLIIPREEFLFALHQLRKQLFELAAVKRLKISEIIKAQEISDLLKDGLRHLGTYHPEKVLKKNDNGDYVTDSLKLLFYYHNHLVGYELERTVKWIE